MREWLRAEREKRDLTLSEMAEKLDISTAYYCYIEKGERQRSLDLSIASKISDIFDIAIEQIVKYEVELKKTA